MGEIRLPRKHFTVEQFTVRWIYGNIFDSKLVLKGIKVNCKERVHRGKLNRMTAPGKEDNTNPASRIISIGARRRSIRTCTDWGECLSVLRLTIANAGHMNNLLQAESTRHWEGVNKRAGTDVIPPCTLCKCRSEISFHSEESLEASLHWNWANWEMKTSFGIY